MGRCESLSFQGHSLAFLNRIALRRPLALAGFVAAALLRLGEHEELRAGNTSTPEQGGYNQQRKQRTGNSTQHSSLSGYDIPNADDPT